VVTPISPASCNLTAEMITVKPLPDGRSDIQAEVRLGGQRALELRSALRGLSAEDQVKVVASKLRESGPPSSIDDSSIKITGAEAWEGPLKISYHSVAPVFAAPTEKRLLLRPALLVHKDESLLTSSRRTNSVYFPYAWSEQDRVEIKVPEGFAAEQLPDEVGLNIGVGTYRSAYKQQKDGISFTRDLTVNGFIIVPQQYQTLKSFFDRAHEGDRG